MITPEQQALLIEFIEARAVEQRQHQASRLDSVKAWRDGTEADHRAGHAIAERMSGRKMPFKKKNEREQLAQIDERIAAKYQQDAELFDAVAAALRAVSRDQGWRDIATAPKDGTTVWLAFAAYQGNMVALPGYFDTKKRWWTEVGDVQATHWQPYRIPSPPEGSRSTP